MNLKAYLLIILIVTTSFSSAQINRKINSIEKLDNQSNVIDITYKTNKSNTYKISNSRKFYRKDSIVKNFEYDYILKEVILKKTDSSSVIEWQLNQKVFLHQIFTQPIQREIEKLSIPFKIIFEVSNQGKILSVINCKEVRDYIISMYKLNDKLVNSIKTKDFILRYGRIYTNLYKDDNNCKNTLELLNITIFDPFYFFQGIPYDIEKTAYISIDDKKSNNYWRTRNKYYQIRPKKIDKQTIVIEDVYYDEFPEKIKNTFPKPTKNDSLKAKKIDKELKSVLEKLESIINQPSDSIQKNRFASTYTYSFYDKFYPKKRYLIYNHKKKYFEKSYTEINYKIIDIKLTSLKQRIISIERL